MVYSFETTDRPSGRIGALPPGLAGVVTIDAYTVYPQVQDLLFTDGKIDAGVWLDPVGAGMPIRVGFEDHSAYRAFVTLLQDEGIPYKS